MRTHKRRKPVLFQLKCKLEAASSNALVISEPILSCEPSTTSGNTWFSEYILKSEEKWKFGCDTNPDNNEDNDIMRYGIYFKDGYNYDQHLWSSANQ